MKKNSSLKTVGNVESLLQFPLIRNQGNYLDIFPVPVISIDDSFLIKSINCEASRLFGNSIINSSFPSLFSLKRTNNDDISITGIFNKLEKSGYEVVFGKEGKQLFFVMTFAAIKDDKGIGSGFIITLSDITKQNEDYNTVNQKLKEKTIMLQEIHHRVKNNLQIISSILTLQMYSTQKEDLSVILIGLQARIRTIALIHEKLYQTDNPSELNACFFLKDLIKILIHVYELNTELILFNCDIDEIILDTDIVLQLGLILNELVTNSVKYAFPTGKGKISASFKLVENKCKLHYYDDGVGIPDSIVLNKTETLGSQLLGTLIEQINGKVEINSKNGTEYIITFPHT